MSDWRDELRDAWDERDGPRLLTLATVDEASEPAARMLVVRDFADNGDLLMCTDARSDKWAELRHQPAASAVVWFEPQRLQFRIRGQCVPEESEAERERVWRAMSDSARSLFAWPAPGEAKAEDDAFVESVKETAEVPSNFGLLRLMPQTVDRLDLRPHPHRRTIWRRQGDDWQGQDVNP